MKKHKKYFGKNITALLCAAAVLLSCMGLFSGCSKEKKNVQIIMTEIVASNRYSLTASDGSSPDWVELYNPTDETADLSNYGLTDNSSEPYRFTFPEGTSLGAGEYMVVYCTGTEDIANEDGILRAGFKISSAGETICLSGRKDQILHAVDLPALEQDVSYGIGETAAEMVYYALPTPAQANSGEHNDTGIFEKEVVTADISINEFMAENKYSIRAADGETYSWVELKNTGSEAVNLSGFGLTDDETNPNKWTFPDIELAPGALQLVFLSGENRYTDGELHAGLTLSTEDGVLMLCDGVGNIVDYVTPLDTDGSVSIGLYGESLVYFAEPTPNAENTTEPYTDLAAAQAYLPELYISEVKSSSEDDIDWVELYNASEESIDLSGYGVSDSRGEAYRFAFSEGTSIGAGEYLVVQNGGEGSYIADIRLAKSGENIYLTDKNGITVDYMNCGTQNIEISRGRKSGGDNTVYYFSSATKGAENTAEVFSTYASAPVFSQIGGIVDSGTQIEISAASGDTIYYTTDGSAPTTSDAQYTGPITITENTPLRARCYADGKLASTVTTENYLVGVAHDLPIVCLSIDPADFTGSEKGIYAKGPGYDVEDGQDYVHMNANYWQDWEREMNFEWFEQGGIKGIDFDAGIKIFGQYSRELAQKSFAIKLRGQYGQNSVTYPFFRDHDITTFYNLVLRQSGQDWDETKIKDAMITQVCKDTNVAIMDYRSCAVYINGEYWGLYNLREKQDADYVASRNPGVAKEDIDVVKADFQARAGSSDDWYDTVMYVRNTDMTRLDAQQYVEDRVNMYSLYDWIAIEVFITNPDSGNKRKYRAGDGKWEWMLFDTDHAAFVNSKNYLSAMMTNDGHGTGNGFNNRMMRAIYANMNWRKQFIERYAELLNTTLRPERFHAIIDAMADEIRSEMPRQIDRWDTHDSVEEWENDIASMKENISNRWSGAVKEIQSTFGLSDERMAELFPNGY